MHAERVNASALRMEAVSYTHLRRQWTPRAFRRHAQIFDCGREGFRERAGVSAPNVAWYPLSLRTDSVNRGISISLLTLASVVLAVSLGGVLFFVMLEH